jgi:hypothetical protein
MHPTHDIRCGYWDHPSSTHIADAERTTIPPYNISAPLEPVGTAMNFTRVNWLEIDTQLCPVTVTSVASELFNTSLEAVRMILDATTVHCDDRV